MNHDFDHERLDAYRLSRGWAYGIAGGSQTMMMGGLACLRTAWW